MNDPRYLKEREIILFPNQKPNDDEYLKPNPPKLDTIFGIFSTKETLSLLSQKFSECHTPHSSNMYVYSKNRYRLLVWTDDPKAIVETIYQTDFKHPVMLRDYSQEFL